ncbi:uncharacterized protein LOC126803010 [Argentina anserina]|uniref:uncharacterized protein LOC126803010 n=1 Tax=Argentina anserina TaxID=57926 RepID=UPI00217665B9|nr:uncharacterized protein LOC126803010 [Potentilla anserina]
MVFGGTSAKLVSEFAKIMEHEFEMSMCGELPYFLGLQVAQSPDGIFLSQSKYDVALVKKFSLDSKKTIVNPMSTSTKLHEDLDGMVRTKKTARLSGNPRPLCFPPPPPLPAPLPPYPEPIMPVVVPTAIQRSPQSHVTQTDHLITMYFVLQVLDERCGMTKGEIEGIYHSSPSPRCTRKASVLYVYLDPMFKAWIEILFG